MFAKWDQTDHVTKSSIRYAEQNNRKITSSRKARLITVCLYHSLHTNLMHFVGSSTKSDVHPRK